MNILFDTNVVIDLFTDTDDFKAAFTAVDVALSRLQALASRMFDTLYSLPAHGTKAHESG